MPTLHALRIGIGNYPNPRHVLRGCVNDMQHLNRYLESYCESMGIKYRPLVLADSAATRQAIIEGFEHFKAADAMDCVSFIIPAMARAVPRRRLSGYRSRIIPWNPSSVGTAGNQAATT